MVDSGNLTRVKRESKRLAAGVPGPARRAHRPRGEGRPVRSPEGLRVSRSRRVPRRFLRVEVGERDHPGRNALLVAVELADLDLGAERRVGDVHAAKRDHPAEDR